MNAVADAPGILTADQLEVFHHDGYLILRHLFSAVDVDAIRRRFDVLAARGQAVPGYWEPDLSPAGSKDPLRRHPRVMHPHRWDPFAKEKLLDRRLYGPLKALLGAEPIAAQSMFYFKPPGARGQAMHQDNFYLQVKPATCLAAWTAIDPARPANGGLYVVPGTQDLEIACPETADEAESFTTHLVRVPPGKKAVSLELEPGDTLFFNGSLIHGSIPNRSNMWRRSFICHYLPATATHISKWYFPLLNFAGEEVTYQPSAEGGPCGKEFNAPVYGA